MKTSFFSHYLAKPSLFALGVVLILSLVSGISPFMSQVEAASPSPTAKATVTPRPSTSTFKLVSTPSPAAESSDDEQATENLKDRIDRVLEQRQEKLRELEQAGQRRRIFIGEVQRIIEQTVTLRTPRGNQTMIIGPEIGMTKDGRKATIDDVAVGDWVGVIGFLDKESIQPQRVFISGTTFKPTNFVTVVGTIKEVTRTQLTVVDANQTDQKFTFTRTTQFQGNDGATIKRENLETDTQVVVVGKTENNQTSALLIKSLAGRR
jgi:hypothetical protein